MRRKENCKPKKKKKNSSYLLRLRRRALPDVRQQLPRQDVPGERDPLSARDARSRRALADVVERRLLRLHGEGLLYRRAQRVEHLRVAAEVVDDVLEDFLIVGEPQGAEHHHDGHVGLDVREAGAQDGPDAAATAAASSSSSSGPSLGEHAHGAGREGASRALGRRAALGGEGVLRGRLSEDVDVVVGHALLRDQDLLGAVDDEVAWEVGGGEMGGRWAGEGWERKDRDEPGEG